MGYYNLQNGRFEKMSIYSFDFFRIVISVLLIVWFVNYLLKLPNRFKKQSSEFLFTEHGIEHIRYMYDRDSGNEKINISAHLNNVNLVSHWER